MTDKEALEAHLRGERLDQATIHRLYRLGLIDVDDVTNHDTRPIGSKEYIATFVTPEGRKLVEGK